VGQWFRGWLWWQPEGQLVSFSSQHTVKFVQRRMKGEIVVGPVYNKSFRRANLGEDLVFFGISLTCEVDRREVA
jgi:hypothetical protein